MQSVVKNLVVNNYEDIIRVLNPPKKVMFDTPNFKLILDDFFRRVPLDATIRTTDDHNLRLHWDKHPANMPEGEAILSLSDNALKIDFLAEMVSEKPFIRRSRFALREIIYPSESRVRKDFSYLTSSGSEKTNWQEVIWYDEDGSIKVFHYLDFGLTQTMPGNFYEESGTIRIRPMIDVVLLKDPKVNVFVRREKDLNKASLSYEIKPLRRYSMGNVITLLPLDIDPTKTKALLEWYLNQSQDPAKRLSSYPTLIERAEEFNMTEEDAEAYFERLNIIRHIKDAYYHEYQDMPKIKSKHK